MAGAASLLPASAAVTAVQKQLKITGVERSDITLEGDLREVDRGGTPAQKVANRHSIKPISRIRHAFSWVLTGWVVRAFFES